MDRELLSEQNSSLDCAKYLLKKKWVEEKENYKQGN